MGLMILFDVESVLPMWLLLVGAVGLTIWESREQGFNLDVTLWWVLLVLLLHVVGYLTLRGWSAWKGNQA